MAYDNVKIASVSETIKSNLLSGDADLIKSATIATNEYFRTEIRENGIRRQLTPVETITRDDLDVAEDTDFPIKYVPVAPRSAGARMVSFETGPRGNVIHSGKVRVEFNRIMTDKYSIDKIRLDTYKMPILDIFYDLMLKDIMDVEDAHWMAIDKDICGTIDTRDPELGCCRYVHAGPLAGSTARPALVHLKKGINVAPGNLQTSKYLMNNLTYCDFAALGREYVGGDAAQDMFMNGVTLTKVMGVETVVTTKKELVPTNDVFIYANPEYYGKFYTYSDVAMVTDSVDDIWMTFFAHETIGGVVVNKAAVARASLTGTLYPWEGEEEESSSSL